METKSNSKGMLWTSRVITALCVLFLVVDAGMKIVEATPAVEGSVQLQWPAEYIPRIGFILMAATILYVIPQTAVLGAVLVTAYLGGATAIMMRTNTPYFFPIAMGVLIWAGLFLRNEKLRMLLPLVK